MSRWRTAISSAALILTLAACGNGSNPDPAASTTPSATDPLVPGACLRDDSVIATDVVPCTDSHTAELLARQDIPAEYFDGLGPTTADHTALAHALSDTPVGAVETKFAAYARAYCTLAMQRVSGLDEADFGEQSAGQVQAHIPLVGYRVAAALNDGADFLRQPLLICTTQLSEPATIPVTQALLTASIPTDWRWCANAHAQQVDCAGPHTSERAVVIDASRLLSGKQIAAESVGSDTAFSPDTQTLLDAACQDALPVLLGGDGDDTVTMRAERGETGWADGAVSDEVSCDFVPADAGEQLTGSAFGSGDLAATKEVS